MSKITGIIIGAVMVLSLTAGQQVFAATTINHSSTSSPGTQLWVKRYDGPTNGVQPNIATAVATSGSEVFVTGYSYSLTSGYDYATIAYDAATGSQLWVKRYNGPGNATDQASAVAVSPDGNTVYVTGKSYGSTTTGYDYATVAYNATTGATSWVKRFNGNNSGSGTADDIATALKVNPVNGTVYVTGSSWGGTSGVAYATVAYSPAGVKLWVQRYQDTSIANDQANALAVSPDGNTVAVTGQSVCSCSSGLDYATITYNASTGAQLWVNRYNGTGNNSDDASSVVFSPNNSTVFITGSSFGSTGGSTTNWDYATIAYDVATGSQVWVQRYNGPDNYVDHAYSIGVSPDGNTVYVTGGSWGVSTASDYATIAYAASTGSQLWVNRYNDPSNNNDVANALTVNPVNGTVYVTGFGGVHSASNGDYTTIAYSSTGTQLWLSYYTKPFDYNVANAIAVNPVSGSVFVTGKSDDHAAAVPDYATVAYSD